MSLKKSGSNYLPIHIVCAIMNIVTKECFMEKNNFNKAYMYIIGIFAIGIAMSNIISFFHGVGFAFIGASLLLFLAISNILKSENKNRFGDIFILLVLEFIMFIILFFAFDFNLSGLSSKFPLVMRNICSIFSMFAIAYILFRYICEIKGVKVKFVEYMLGNHTPNDKEKKVKQSREEVKKNKELENGTLEPKPSSVFNGPINTSNDEDANNEAESADEIVESSEENEEEVSQEVVSEAVTNETNRSGHWY